MSAQTDSALGLLLTEANNKLQRAGEFLQLAVDGIPPVSDAQMVYTKRQAESVANVALDVHLLVSHQRFQNVVGLCRIGFESRISMCAALRVPEFAAQKLLAGVEGHVGELEDLIKSGVKSPSFHQALEKHRQLLNQMRNDFGEIQARKWWPFSEVAKAANLLADYEEHYSTLSKAAHNTPTGLFSKDDLRILVSTVLRLLHDTIEACVCLVFFREHGNSRPKPLTAKWKELAEPINTLKSEHGELSGRLIALCADTLRGE